RARDTELTGAPGKAISGRDALGRDIDGPRILKPPVAGQGVMLTLDTNIQYIAEREIDVAFRRTGARAAMAVVLEPRTGDVLAVAIRPTFNPNTFLEASTKDAWRNREVTDSVEPGSIFQVLLAATAHVAVVVRGDDPAG